MADSQPTSPHPSFQPRPGKEGVAASYLLWVISGKVFIKPSGCWFWGGGKSDDGYGVLEVQGKIHRVTRLIFDYCVAPIPEGGLVLHDCDSPPCCNPSHFYVGTHKDNALDCRERGRTAGMILNPDAVLLVRELAAKGRRRADIAKRVGTSVDSVDDILSGRKWGHVQ